LLEAWRALDPAARGAPMIGVAIECATERADVVVRDGAGERAGAGDRGGRHGHTRRLTGLLRRALERAGVRPGELKWIAADLGPGSFTGVRVGLATAAALAAVSGARLRGASSLAALAHGAPRRRALTVPLVPAGRHEAYVGSFARTRGPPAWWAPRVLRLPDAVAAIEETRTATGLSG
jgi:tRNA threonylcarbamoyladenosine biosynthesis protein TsaB